MFYFCHFYLSGTYSLQLQLYKLPHPLSKTYLCSINYFSLFIPISLATILSLWIGLVRVKLDSNTTLVVEGQETGSCKTTSYTSTSQKNYISPSLQAEGPVHLRTPSKRERLWREKLRLLLHTLHSDLHV